MKTPRVALSGASVACLAALCVCAISPSRASDAAKDHRLFVGSDFTVKLKGRLLPVVSAGDRTFVLQDGDQRREYPIRKLRDVQIVRGLKLTRFIADVTNIDARLSSEAQMAEQFEAAQTSKAVTTL